MDSRKNGRKRFRISVRTAALIVCAFLLITGGVLAKYITSNRQRAEMESAQFHISSNYLEEESKNASYTVADWGNGFDILLFNYEKENIAQVSGVDMTYTVTADNASVSITGENGGTVTPDADGRFIFTKAENNTQHTLHVTPNDNVAAGEEITVTVQTTSPYRKTLTADFTIQRNRQPDYTVEDQHNGTVLVTVKTNDYSNNITVMWDPAKFSPDNTNLNMTSWKDTEGSGAFTVSRDSTYELLFFKNTNGDYTTTSGTGTTITLE